MKKKLHKNIRSLHKNHDKGDKTEKDTTKQLNKIKK